MGKINIVIMMTVLMMSIVLGACLDEQYYPGMTCNFTNEMNTTNLIYTIIDNSTIVPPLNMIIGKENITITFPGDMTPDSFKLVFIEKIVEVVKVSGGHHTRYVDRNVTVFQPMYLESNITSEPIVKAGTYQVEGPTCPVEKTIVEDKGFKLWQILLGIVLIIGLIAIGVIIVFFLVP